MKKPHHVIDEAIARLKREVQIPLVELDGEPVVLPEGVSHPTAAVLLRWGTQGRRGIFLDVLMCRKRLTWVTSREAISRFVAAVGARAGAKTG